MKFLCSEKISQHKYKTPEGYLVCVDSVLARTGKQDYKRCEAFGDACDNPDDVVAIDRKPEEVFSDATLASFENKPLTVEHPDEDVNVANHNDYAVGFVRDVKRGKNESGDDVMLGTLVITDKQTIDEIEAGEHTDLSCGYDCDIVDEDNPQQRNIRGNHVALCQHGRAGNAHIVDSTKAIAKDNIDSGIKVAEVNYGYCVVAAKYWRNYKENAFIDRHCNSIDEAKYIKQSLERNDKIDFVIVDCTNALKKKVVDSIKDYGEGQYLLKVAGEHKYWATTGGYTDNLRKTALFVSADKAKEYANFIWSKTGWPKVDYYIYKIVNNDAAFEQLDLVDLVRAPKKDSVKDVQKFNIGENVVHGGQLEKGIVEKVYQNGNLYIRWNDYIRNKNGRVEVAGEYDPKETIILKANDSINDIEPRKDESKEDFISRFMSETKSEYPDEKQRLAVAYSYWRKAKGEDSMKDGDFSKTTKQGYIVEELYREGGRLHAIVKRNNDYVVALGYDTTSGEWGQGRYVSTKANAITTLMEEKPNSKRVQDSMKKDSLSKIISIAKLASKLTDKNTVSETELRIEQFKKEADKVKTKADYLALKSFGEDIIAAADLPIIRRASIVINNKLDEISKKF